MKCIDWHPHKGLLASGSKDNLVKLWDPKTGQALSTLYVWFYLSSKTIQIITLTPNSSNPHTATATKTPSSVSNGTKTATGSSPPPAINYSVSTISAPCANYKVSEDTKKKLVLFRGIRILKLFLRPVGRMGRCFIGMSSMLFSFFILSIANY